MGLRHHRGLQSAKRAGERVCVGQGLVINLTDYCFQRGQQTKTCKDQEESDKNREQTNKQSKAIFLGTCREKHGANCTLTLAPRDPVRLLAHSTLHLSSTLAVAVVTAAVGNWHIGISDVRPSFFPSPFMISLLNTQL